MPSNPVGKNLQQSIFKKQEVKSKVRYQINIT